MRRVALIALLLVLGAAGCGGSEVVAPTAGTVEGTLPSTGGSTGDGDASDGKSLFASQGCNGCHTYTPAGSKASVGPNLDELAKHAEAANQGSVEEYTAVSIENPGAYIAPGFPENVMPAYASLADQQVADLVAFLTNP
ncbi:MAG: cytochrome c [Actinobacteria bacterium]|nr:cytochrome c [Actinomycetota bacterium]